MNLVQKCFAFLAIVLVVQLGLFLSFFSLLAEAEHNSQDANEARVLVAHLDKLTRIIDNSMWTFIAWGLNHSSASEREYKRTINLATSEIGSQETRAAIRSPKTTALINQFDARALMLIDSVRQIHDDCKNNVPLQQIAAVQRLFKAEVAPQVADLRTCETELRNSNNKLANQSESTTAHYREVIVKCIVGSFLANLLFTFAAVIGFSRGVIRRLTLVRDNITRFWRATPLNPPLPGNDEISWLDASFHNMARNLIEAREVEQGILLNMPIGLLVCSSAGTIDSVHARCEQLFSSSAEALIGKRFVDFIDEPNIDFETVINGEQFRVWKIKSTTSAFAAELSVSRLYHSGHHKFLVAIMDVTAREEIDRLKQEFLAVIGHDIRTPLTSISLGINLLIAQAAEILPDASKRNMTNIQQNCDHLLSLTRDLLQIVKLESDKIELDIEQTDIISVFEKSMNAVTLVAEEKEITIDCQAIDLTVHWDENKIVQVLVNLLSNAVKFSRAGQTVMLTAIDHDDHVRIEVKDQGVGIGAEHQQIIFEKFKQARRTDAQTGTGLGLAISKLLIEAHSGTIGVDSTPAVGSTFWINVPIHAPLANKSPST